MSIMQIKGFDRAITMQQHYSLMSDRLVLRNFSRYVTMGDVRITKLDAMVTISC